MGTADSLQDHDTSHTKLDQLKPIIQRWEESVQLDPNFHRLIALAPDHANAYFGRGAAYAALGDFDKAIPDFDTAIQLDPDHALAYFNCGVAYAALGNTDQAVENLEASLVTDPKASYVPQVRAMLAKLRTQRE